MQSPGRAPQNRSPAAPLPALPEGETRLLWLYIAHPCPCGKLSLEHCHCKPSIMCFTFDCHFQAEACGLSSDKSCFSCRLKVGGARSQEIELCTPLWSCQNTWKASTSCASCASCGAATSGNWSDTSLLHMPCACFSSTCQDPMFLQQRKLTGFAIIQSGVTHWQEEYLHGMAPIQRHWLTDDAVCLIMLAICQTACHGIRK